MRKAFLLSICLLSVVGCGGKDGNKDGIDTFFDSFDYAYDHEDVPAFSRIVSSSFLNNCADKSDLVASFADMADTDGIDMEVDFSDIDRDVEGNYAVVTCTMHEQAWVYGTKRLDETNRISMGLRNESGTWRLYGNQLCGGTAPAVKKGGALAPTVRR